MKTFLKLMLFECLLCAEFSLTFTALVIVHTALAVALSVALRAVVPRMRMVSVTVQFAASPAMMFVFHCLIPPSPMPFTVDLADCRTVNVFAFPFSVSALESSQLCAPCAVPIQMFPSSF